MRRRRSWVAVTTVGALLAAAGPLLAQPPEAGLPPSFERQIAPIFEARCIICHGAAEQKGGLRLDDRAAAMKGGRNGPVIVPGNSAESRLFHLIETGKMPIDEQLSVLEVTAIKTWIDRGAPWPEPRVAVRFDADPRIEAWRQAVRNRDRATANRLLRDAGLTRGRKADGSTALHYAAQLGDLSQVRALLDAGAEINAEDADGVTPLMLAMTDPAKVRLLLDRGANINAVSRAGRTPLIIAAAQPGAVDLVADLLRRGAKVAPDQVSNLAQAAGAVSDPAMLRLLYPRVLDPRGPAGAQAALDAGQRNCWECMDYLLQQGVRGPQLGLALVFAANNGDAAALKRLLDSGAPLNARGPHGATALLAAATSEFDRAEKVRLLLEAGADPNLAANDGRTPLAYARDRHPEIAPMLIAKGAK